MYPKPITAYDIDIAARTVWGEARGEPLDGKLAVAWVIRNRAEKGGWFGEGLAGVSMKPWQFSVWNKNDVNREKLLELKKDSRGYQQALAVVARSLVTPDDPTHGANHYHTKDIFPHWAEDADAVLNVGNHLFYRL
jgi:spore germination cell wall hydrolase CwlJ-like protein